MRELTQVELEEVNGGSISLACAAILGVGAVGVGAVGVGAVGAGVIGAGVIGAGAMGGLAILGHKRRSSRGSSRSYRLRNRRRYC